MSWINCLSIIISVPLGNTGRYFCSKSPVNLNMDPSLTSFLLESLPDSQRQLVLQQRFRYVSGIDNNRSVFGHNLDARL